MRRRVELDRAQYLANTVSNRNCENTTKNWCKIEKTSRDRTVKDRLLKEQLEEEELQRRRQAAEEEHARAIRERAEREKAADLMEQRRLAICDEKTRQKLREECEELRVLEAQLRTAYVAKENAYQMGERRARQLQEKIAVERERLELEKQQLAAQKEDEMRLRESMREREEFRHCLQQQMTETFNRKRVCYDDFLREKQWIDEITQRLQEEQVEAVERKLQRIQEAAETMEQYRVYREQAVRKQKLQMAEENQRIFEYLRVKEANEEQEAAEKRAQLEQKSAVADKLAQSLSQLEVEARKREELMVELNMKELAKKEEIRLRKQLEDQLRKRVLVRLELQKQRESRWIRQEQEREEEKMFKEEQLRQMAEADRLELLSNEMRRRKQVEHRRAVEKLLQDRKEGRIKEMNDAKKKHSEELQDAKRVREMIEEERIKILQEHAQELIGFLPVGILKTTDGQQLPLPTTKQSQYPWKQN